MQVHCVVQLYISTYTICTVGNEITGRKSSENFC